MNAPVAQPLPRLQPTPFGGGTPCGKGGDHAHRLSASPKGGREGGRTKIPLYKFIDNSVSSSCVYLWIEEHPIRKKTVSYVPEIVKNISKKTTRVF